MSGWTKTKTYESHHFDSEAWSVVKPRPDDIVIATAYKSGTTWMQQIIAQLIFDGKRPENAGLFNTTAYPVERPWSWKAPS